MKEPAYLAAVSARARKWQAADSPFCKNAVCRRGFSVSVKRRSALSRAGECIRHSWWECFLRSGSKISTQCFDFCLLMGCRYLRETDESSTKTILNPFWERREPASQKKSETRWLAFGSLHMLRSDDECVNMRRSHRLWTTKMCFHQGCSNNPSVKFRSSSYNK